MTGVELYKLKRNFLNGKTFKWRGHEWAFTSLGEPVEIKVTRIYIESSTADYLLGIAYITDHGIYVKGRAPKHKKEGGFFRLIYNHLTQKNEKVDCFIKYSEMQGL